MTTAKKTTARKVSVARTPTKKKTTKVKHEKRALVCANGEECFWTTDGSIITNLIELRDLFAHIAEDVYLYHVKKDKNDFAEWVEHVLADGELATELRKAKKSGTAHTIVSSRLKVYEI